MICSIAQSHINSRELGFTLLELVTVLAIVSILILVSYPVYTHHILKTRRAQAEVALLDIASGLERYYAVNNTYVGATLASVEVNEYTQSDAYQLEISRNSEADYLIQAKPLAAQAGDVLCGVLSLDAMGIKGVGGAGKVADCW